MAAFIISVTTTLTVAGITVASILYFLSKHQDRARSEQIDREYRELCQDPRYQNLQ